MKTCEMLQCCGFFRKYENSNIIECRGFITTYCKGNKMDECARLDYYKKYNKFPSDDMLPSGKIIDCGKYFEPYQNNIQQFF